MYICNCESIAKKLKQLRNFHKLTFSGLSYLTGISVDSLKSYENISRNSQSGISLRHVVKLLNIYDVSFDYLLSNENDSTDIIHVLKSLGLNDMCITKLIEHDNQLISIINSICEYKMEENKSE